MSSILKSLFTLVAVICFCYFAVPAGAQGIEPDIAGGIQPFNALAGGNLDNIDLMSNLHLTFHAPLVAFPQRGALKLDFQLFYNSKSFYVFTDTSNNKSWRATWAVPGVAVTESQEWWGGYKRTGQGGHTITKLMYGPDG